MKQVSKLAFSLIELMVVITILVIMLTMSYAPYKYMQQKAKLKIASREISQSLYEGKNFARSWVKTPNITRDSQQANKEIQFINSSIWVFLNTSAWKNGYIYFYTYPYSTNTGTLVSPLSSTSTATFLKKKALQDGVVIEGNNDILFFYEAISGVPTVVQFPTWESNSIPLSIDSVDGIDIHFSFKNTDSEKLKKSINYNPITGTVNYNNYETNK